MIVIGEKINATRKKIGQAVEAKDAEAILAVAREQVEAGVDYLDINGGDPAKEIENMEWLVNLVQDNFDTPLSLDSANAKAIARGLELAKNPPLINSITAETDRLEQVLPVIAAKPCRVIALTMSDDGPPRGVEDRLGLADTLLDKLSEAGKKPDDILVDFCVFPVSSEGAAPLAMAEAIQITRKKVPGLHFCAGLSNVSYGLPARVWVNRTFLSILIGYGLDSVICDPNAPGMLATIAAGEALAGRDEFCMNYLNAHRSGKLES